MHPRGSIKQIFIHNTDKPKNKQVTDKHPLVLNLKKMCFGFSKKTNNNSNCLKKIKAHFVKSTPFILNTLLIDFIVFIIQNLVKKSCLLHKITIEKARSVSKNTDVFIKNKIYFFIPQHRLKER